MTLPREFGFAMPPEWALHARTFITWPVCEDTWPDELEEVRDAYAHVAKTIARFEPVTVIARPHLADDAARRCGENVTVLAMDYDDSWIRDNGPTFIKKANGEVAAINWQFNAWGGKYAWEKDNLVAPAIISHYGVRSFDAPFIMEGGSLHVDGEGTLLTTEECLLNPNRNPHLDKSAIEAELRQYLGIDKVIWLKQGLDGDHTDGHVDNVACFSRPGTVLIQACYDPADPNYAIYQENLAILQAATDAQGRSLEIIPIEQPPALYLDDLRMAASYINFYTCNGGIILPVFGGECAEADQKAQAIIQKAFPNHEVVPVDGRLILTGGGNVHCLTQQMPK